MFRPLTKDFNGADPIDVITDHMKAIQATFAVPAKFLGMDMAAGPDETVMMIRKPRVIIGFIFRMDICGYYREYGKGSVDARSQAHIYQAKDIEHYINQYHHGYDIWGKKDDGHWIAVYGEAA